MKELGRFLIFAGGSRSGSNAVYYYLDQHPQTCMTRKTEVHFFSEPCLKKEVAGPGDTFEVAEIPATFAAFLDSFYPCEEGQIRVSICPSLLYHYRCAENITHHVDDRRLVFVLRNPVDKAFSHYLHMKGDGRERLTFMEGLEEEDERARLGYSDGFMYRRNGLYLDALKHFKRIFGENMRVFLHDDLVRDPLGVMREICEFAGIDSSFPFKRIGHVNRSGVTRYRWLAWLTGPNLLTYLLRRVVPTRLGRNVRSAIREWNTGPKETISPEARRIILDHVSDDIRALEEWLGRSTGWLEADYRADPIAEGEEDDGPR